MKNLLTGIWNKIKWPLFLILWTAGTISWMYFYQEFRIIRCEASATWEQHIERIENKKKDDVSMVDEKVSLTLDPVRQEEVAAPEMASPPSSEIEKTIYEKFGDSNYKTALAIAKAESRLNPIARNTNRNGTEDCGIFQINSIHNPSKIQCEHPEENAEMAYQIFQRHGWTAWSVYNNKRYLAFL
jgi:hypothetical protein